MKLRIWAKTLTVMLLTHRVSSRPANCLKESNKDLIESCKASIKAKLLTSEHKAIVQAVSTSYTQVRENMHALVASTLMATRSAWVNKHWHSREVLQTMPTLCATLHSNNARVRRLEFNMAWGPPTPNLHIITSVEDNRLERHNRKRPLAKAVLRSSQIWTRR